MSELLKKQNYGVEVEFTGISRKMAADAVAEIIGKLNFFQLPTIALEFSSICFFVMVFYDFFSLLHVFCFNNSDYSFASESIMLIISIQIHLFHPLSAVRGNKVFHCPSVSSSSHLCSGSLIRAERSSRCSPGSFCRKKSLPAKICKFLWCCVFDIFY